MADKTLKTRIQVRYDEYSAWTTKNPVLLKGEIAVATIKEGATQEVGSIGLPQVLIKVGDGTNHYNDLKFISARDADVYEWAKQEKPVYVDSENKYQDLSTRILSHINAISDLQSRVGELEDFEEGNANAVTTAINTALSGLTVADVTGGKVVTKVVQNNGKIEVTKGNLAIADLTDGTKTIDGLKGRLNDLESFKETVTNDYATDDELGALENKLNTKIGTDIGDAKTKLIGDAATENTILWAKDAADKAAAAEVEVLKEIYATLESGKPARNLLGEDEEKDAFINSIGLITAKPMLYAANICDDDLIGGVENEYVKRVRDYSASEGSETFVICAKIEQELSELDEEEKAAFLEDLGLTSTGFDRLVAASYKLLGLISYLTAGEQEVRAWTIKVGTKAPGAAGKIHSDFERGFIRAEIVNFEDLVACGSYTAAKEKGLVRLEGKEYVVQDGDIILFRFNV